MARFQYVTEAMASNAGAATHTVRVPRECEIQSIRIVRTVGAALPTCTFYRAATKAAADLLGPGAITPASANHPEDQHSFDRHATAGFLPLAFSNGDDGQPPALTMEIAAGAGVTYTVVVSGEAWSV